MSRYLNMAVLAVLATLFVAAPGSFAQTSSDYDPRSAPEMAGWETYAWMPHPADSDERLDPLVAARIKLAVERALSEKGYKPAGASIPDFLVGYHAAAKGVISSKTVNTYYTAGYGKGGVGPSGVQTQSREYEQGSLVLDIYNGETKELAWRGQAQAEIGKDDSADKRRKRLHRVLTKMLEGFPPPTE